ncbi:MAG TPA: helix-turn-helix domain-containing protein, partial [Tissierellales bacterium]|nr:helix-turn-helix domain-containing protein [Tissierellales bacterium]
ISWGISENKVHNYSFNKAFLDAKISLEILHNEKEPGYRNIYHNTSIYRLLSILSNDQDTQTIIMDIIGNLIQHDSENNLELIHTFKTYIKNKGNVSKTARTLHLHRQSLLYRLKRIEEITELSLDNADDVFLLELCIRLWDKKDKLLI